MTDGGEHDDPHVPTAAGYRRISIDPITRLEGHGKIDIFLDADGRRGRLLLPGARAARLREVLRGPPGRGDAAHHAAHLRRLPRGAHDGVGQGLRRRLRGDAARSPRACSASCSTTSSTSPTTPRTSTRSRRRTSSWARAATPPQRNLIGVIRKLGRRDRRRGDQVPASGATRRRRSSAAGRSTPINAIPGGMSKPITPTSGTGSRRSCGFMVEFGKFTLKVLHDQVLANKEYLRPDPQRPVPPRDLLDGPRRREEPRQLLRRQGARGGPGGHELCKYAAARLPKHVAERVEPWSYLKFPYLTEVGWKGFVDGKESGVYRATPQSRLNVADGMSTPLAQEAYEEYFETLTGDRTGTQARPPHAGHPLGPRRRADERRRARARAGAPPRDHAPRELPGASRRDADRGRRHRRGAARHAHPPLRDRRERHRPEGQPDRGHDEQPRGHLHVDQEGGAGADPQGRRGDRGPAEHDRDGVPRLRPVLRLRHAQPAGTDAARGAGAATRRGRLRSRAPRR